MAKKSIFAQKAYWKSVVGLGIGFAIVFNIVSILFEYGGFHFAQYLEDRIAAGSWFRFLSGQILGALIYGIIIAYGQFKVRQKKDAASQEN